MIYETRDAVSILHNRGGKQNWEGTGREGGALQGKYGYTGNIQHELKAFDVRRRKSKNTCSACWAMSNINHACINVTQQPVT